MQKQILKNRNKNTICFIKILLIAIKLSICFKILFLIITQYEAKSPFNTQTHHFFAQKILYKNKKSVLNSIYIFKLKYSKYILNYVVNISKKTLLIYNKLI